IVLFGLGSGVVLAAKGSRPGSLLFPLKKVIIQTQMNLTTDPIQKKALEKEVEIPAPTLIFPTEEPIASPTAKPTIKIKEHEGVENEKEVEGVSVSATPLPHITIHPKEPENVEKNNLIQPILH